MFSTACHELPMPSPTPPVCEDVPTPDHITPYDKAHFVTYLQLLDASTAGATEADMARLVLGIDPIQEPGRAARVLANHLARARWMTTQSYRHLLQK
jgi:hypothetical protein